MLLAGSARADRAADIAACVAASEHGQLHRKAGKLVEAASELLACSKSACPVQIRPDCERWHREVTDSLPTIVVAVRDGKGDDVTDARITLDSQALAVAVSGRALPVDPGPHVVRAERAAGETAEQRFVVREGEKLRAISLAFPRPPGDSAAGPPLAATSPTPPPDAAEAPRAAPPVLAYALLGAGALGVGVGTFFFLKQNADYNDLERTCAPHCDRGDAQAIDDQRLVAGIAGGVGVAAAIAGAWLLFASPRAPAAATSAKGARLMIAGSGLRLRFDY